jgi:hypothetical protein
MNILIVESENDQYFVQGVTNFLNNKETIVCKIDDYRHSSLDKIKLKTQIGSALTTRGVSKIGVMLDMDEDTLQNRLQLVNNALITALNENFGEDFKISKPIEYTNEFVAIRIDEFTTIHCACYFTNIDGNGELETLLKAIQKQDSIFADCLLEGWKACVQSKGKKIVKRGEAGDITDKELLKLWVDFYKRFDTLKKGNWNKDSTDWKGIWLGTAGKKGDVISPRGYDIFNLEAAILEDLKTFLLLFH